MKSLSLLKKIALGSGVVAAVTPIALMTTTSCAIEDVNADYIDFNSIRENGNYNNAIVGTQSYKKLLFGSKRVNNGNYILIFGSNIFPTTCKFFSGSENLYRERRQWFTNYSEETPYGVFNLSPFYHGIAKTESEEPGYNNFGIFNVIDFFDFKFYDKKGHQITICEQENIPTEVIGPWDKWTEQMINQTRLYNKTHGYEWDEKSVSTSEYIRNDQSAILFREFCKTGLQIYPKTKDRTDTFSTEDKNRVSRMMVFKDGKLQQKSESDKKDIFDIPTDKDAWYEIIQHHFKKKES